MNTQISVDLKASDTEFGKKIPLYYTLIKFIPPRVNHIFKFEEIYFFPTSTLTKLIKMSTYPLNFNLIGQKTQKLFRKLRKMSIRPSVVSANKGGRRAPSVGIISETCICMHDLTYETSPKPTTKGTVLSFLLNHYL